MESLADIIQSLTQVQNSSNRTEKAAGKPANKEKPTDEKSAAFITFPVSIGLLEGKHVEAMGIAVWCFLWCINRVTFDKTDSDGQRWGQVLGGCVFTQQRIADELSLSLRAVRYQLDRLKKSGYLRITRCRDGQVIEVRHSIKWLRRKNPPKPTQTPPDKPTGEVVSLVDALLEKSRLREMGQGKLNCARSDSERRSRPEPDEAIPKG